MQRRSERGRWQEGAGVRCVTESVACVGPVCGWNGVAHGHARHTLLLFQISTSTPRPVEHSQRSASVTCRGCLIHEISATAPTHSAIVPTSTITITRTAASPLQTPPARPLAAPRASRQQPWPHARSESCSSRSFRSLELVLTHDSHSITGGRSMPSLHQ
jgi:hypothetical protein